MHIVHIVFERALIDDATDQRSLNDHQTNDRSLTGESCGLLGCSWKVGGSVHGLGLYNFKLLPYDLKLPTSI